ncbi:SGNH/GDSL hydrolase family protein [Paenibacillus koleovorans]|uniref:SGNH/GDSL hydrolase family protein n=1 Tax=Paenibacillus koleovorans TaxID=121608 RepID=UPI000FD99244|nr:GDSL-type esterase/lipase family protein [Paenibacillus koleovorans]
MEKSTVEGLRITSTAPASMAVVVQPGQWRRADGTTMAIEEPVRLPIRSAGQRLLHRQAYKIKGQAERSPAGWNGENIRGSGGDPYQRMVPGTLSVYNADRTVLYTADRDYVHDYYWGTIKRHPQGRIENGDKLSLDYAVWLCRYDAVVLTDEGRLVVVEGNEEAPESRELMLPEPPLVRDGLVLAHVFVAWGTDAIYDGGSRVRGNSSVGDSVAEEMPRLTGRYEDTECRTYCVEVVEGNPQATFVRIGATGEDYGLGVSLQADTMRWSEPFAWETGSPLPLWLNSAYGHHIDWGLALDWALMERASLPVGRRFEVEAVPELIFDLRFLEKREPVESIPVERGEGLGSVIDKFRAGSEPLRIAFFGESTTRSGHWPYQVIRGLKQLYPATRIFSSNVAVGGESSTRGRFRMDEEVLPLNPDLTFVEYMINDSCTGDLTAIRESMSEIVERLQAGGSHVVILSHNGMNPLFWEKGNSGNYMRFHRLYRELAEQYRCSFIGGYAYFHRLHEYGKHYLTELKGNMVNHPYGNVDAEWGPFDEATSSAIMRLFGESD